MKERPILFSGPMVRAILDGKKTQTRRVIKLPLKDPYYGCEIAGCEMGKKDLLLCPYGVPGDKLWVRETWRTINDPAQCIGDSLAIDYRADGIVRIGDKIRTLKWKPSIFMPRWASRIALEIVCVRKERLQTIAYYDCEAEGMTHLGRGVWNCPGFEEIFTEGREGYRRLWNSINGKTHPWESNPWVWVIDFKRR